MRHPALKDVKNRLCVCMDKKTSRHSICNAHEQGSWSDSYDKLPAEVHTRTRAKTGQVRPGCAKGHELQRYLGVSLQLPVWRRSHVLPRGASVQLRELENPLSRLRLDHRLGAVQGSCLSQPEAQTKILSHKYTIVGTGACAAGELVENASDCFAAATTLGLNASHFINKSVADPALPPGCTVTVPGVHLIIMLSRFR